MQTEQQTTDYLREAREILASFIEKRGAHEAKLAELGRERAALSYSAHLGDPKARKRLDALHLEHAKADSEFLSIDAAVQTAQDKVKDAENAVSKATAADKALKVLALLPILEEHGKILDNAAAQVLASYTSLQNTARTLRTLTNTGADDAGIQRDRCVVTDQHLRVACKRALIAALIGTDLQVEALAPSERHSFAQLCDSWTEGAANWARRRLPEEVAS
jgi:hypothetical protein